QKWKTQVGEGDASPALVGDKVYTFTRQGGDEVITCLDAANGKIAWQEKYAATAPPDKPAGGPHRGPRSTPAVAEGKVCTLGVRGTVSCLDAATGKGVGRKDTKTFPTFFTSSSPLILDGKCIVYANGLTAYDLATGEEKWKWSGEGAPYGSPILMTVEGTKQLVTPTSSSIAGVNAADGKLLWKVPFKAKYMSCTPVVEGQTVIYFGQGAGTVALKIEKQRNDFAAKELWKKSQSPPQYNTPVLKDGLLYGLSPSRNFYCMNAQTGDTLWTDATARGQCGTILDAGGVLLALTSDMNMVAFKPSN